MLLYVTHYYIAVIFLYIRGAGGFVDGSISYFAFRSVGLHFSIQRLSNR